MRAIDALVVGRSQPWTPTGSPSRCTGISAHWCPNHGTCSCPYDDGWIHYDACDVATGREFQIRAHDPACPLHGTDSLCAA